MRATGAGRVRVPSKWYALRMQYAARKGEAAYLDNLVVFLSRRAEGFVVGRWQGREIKCVRQNAAPAPVAILSKRALKPRLHDVWLGWWWPVV